MRSARHNIGVLCVSCLALGLAFTSSLAHAAPPDRSQCLASYDEAQRLRADRKLSLARERLLECSAPSCPQAMQPECLRWLSEVDAEMPTIVVRARLADGTDTADVHVIVDGREVESRLDGGAIPLDPGEHTLRFERPGSDAVTQSVVARLGERLRPIEVTLSSHAATTQPPATSEESSPSVRPRWPGYVLATVGLAGIASFSYFGLRGVLRYEQLKNDCSPSCAPSDSHDVKQSFQIADVSIGASAIAFAAASYFVWWRPGAHDDDGHVDVSLTPERSGASLSLRASF